MKKCFTVSDETYIGMQRTAPVSFITYCKSYATDCKSDNSICKFCQPLQLVTTAGTSLVNHHKRGWLKTEIRTTENVSPGIQFAGQSHCLLGDKFSFTQIFIGFSRLLPTAYVVWGKVIFWHMSVRLARSRQGGYPSQVQMGVPQTGPTGVLKVGILPGQGWGTPLSQVWWGITQGGIFPQQGVPPGSDGVVMGAKPTFLVFQIQVCRTTYSYVLGHVVSVVVSYSCSSYFLDGLFGNPPIYS